MITGLTAAVVFGAALGLWLGKTSLELQRTYDSAGLKVVGILFVAGFGIIWCSALLLGTQWLFTHKLPNMILVITFCGSLHVVAAIRRIVRTTMWGNYRPC